METNMFSGVWPTMITPFTEGGAPDFPAIEKMVDWYVEKGCAGIFAVCQSSEMFFLTVQEKLDIARTVRDAAGGRVRVIASGHTADSLDEQKRDIEKMAALSLDAIVLVSNRFAAENEGEDVFRANAESVFRAFPEVPFGIYECPYPYKRLLTTGFLKTCAETKQLHFLKDTCCDPVMITERADAVRDTDIALFNANAATILASLRDGYKGYNGVMANYHPELYVWLVENFRSQPEKAEQLADILTLLAMTEARSYPVTAKYHFNRTAVPMTLNARSADVRQFTVNDRLGIDALIGMEGRIAGYLQLS